MARVTLPTMDYLKLDETCPCCGGDVEVVAEAAGMTVIDCSRCTWADLACKVYDLEPEEIPLCNECFSPTHPY